MQRASALETNSLGLRLNSALANSLTLDDSLPARSLTFLLYEMEVLIETLL